MDCFSPLLISRRNPSSDFKFYKPLFVKNEGFSDHGSDQDLNSIKLIRLRRLVHMAPWLVIRLALQAPSIFFIIACAPVSPPSKGLLGNSLKQFFLLCWGAVQNPLDTYYSVRLIEHPQNSTILQFYWLKITSSLSSLVHYFHHHDLRLLIVGEGTWLCLFPVTGNGHRRVTKPEVDQFFGWYLWMYPLWVTGMIFK